RELLPTTSVIALLINPTNPTAETISKDVQASARVLGQVVHILNASTEREIDTAFERIAELRAGALLVPNDAFFNNRPGQFIALAARHALPAISMARVCPGRRPDELWNQHRVLVSRTRHLRRTCPQGRQASRFAGAAVDQGRAGDQPQDGQCARLTFPITLLGRADEVIE